MVSCKIVSGGKWTPLIGAFPPPSNIDHLPDLEEALNRFLGRNYILMGDLNAGTSRLQNPWSQEVSDFLDSFGLANLLVHFRQHLRLCHTKTWWKFQNVRLLLSCCNYVLGSDLRLFEMGEIRDSRNFASDHFAL